MRRKQSFRGRGFGNQDSGSQNFRYQRRNEDVRRELSVLIREELKDPRVSPLTDVTGVKLTPDLRYCKVYFSVLGEEAVMEETLAGLQAAAGFLRRALAQNLNMRHTPELVFVYDRSVRFGSEMDALIQKVSEADASRPEGVPVNAENVYKMEEAEEAF